MNGIEAVQGTNGAAYIIGKGQDKAEKTSVIFEPNVDKFNISGDYDFAKGEVGLREFFDSLKKDFPMIEFYVGDRFSDCTAADKNGVSVVLSERFMEKLVSGGDKAAEYRDKLVNALKGFMDISKGKEGTGMFVDTDGAVCWEFTNDEKNDKYKDKLNSVKEMLKQFELANSQKKEKNSRQNMLSGGVSNLYSMAAMTRDKPGVMAVVAKVNRQISTLKMSASGAKGAEAAKINATIKSLKKLISKCNSKIRKIEKAEQAEMEYKRAVKRKSQKKAEEHMKEMKRRKRLLHCENESIKNIGMLEDWKNSNNFKLMDDMDKYNAMYSSYTAGGDASLSAGTADVTGMPMGDGIAVTGTIAF